MKKISLMKAAQSALFVPVLLVCMATMVNGEEKKYQRTVENFMIPDVTLINQDREKVRFKDFMQYDKPVLVDFIFSTCSTICPVLSVSFVNLQHKLGDESGSVRLVSISIDPENDTPRLMKGYLKRYHAKPGWDFLTGSRKDINSVMRAFNAYIPDKMSHYPLMFIRMPRDGKWVRTFGIMSTSELIAEVQKADIR
jgi:protein SCO1/2